MNRSLLLPMLMFAVLTLVSTGCSTLQPSSWTSPKLAWWKKQPELPVPQVPSRLVSTWIDTSKHTPGQKSERGFGGRIMFFTNESEKPVHVDGQLVVYAYDESEGDPNRVEPTRRYVFPAAQFAKHQSECSLGPSYSVWLPWDEVGGPMKNISLITRFEPKGGALVAGEPTSHMLSGTQLADSSNADVKNNPSIRLSQHTEEIRSIPLGNRLREPEKTSAKKELTTTSIRVPKAWAER